MILSLPSGQRPVARFIVRRILGAIPVLFGLSLILFFFLRLLPGDPAIAILGQHATPELIARIHESLGLDKPIIVQYFIYLGNLLHGDFGSSIIDSRAVSEIFAVRFPVTVELTPTKEGEEPKLELVGPGIGSASLKFS